MDSSEERFAYRVSVIVPVYNQEPYLEDSVGSLLNQTMPPEDFEILLIDDGSTDISPQMCDSYAELCSNVRTIHKQNGGLSDARNCGIDNARGKYLMFLDADDTLKEDTLMSVADFFDKHYEEVDLVAYPSVTFKKGERVSPHYRYKTLKDAGVYDLSADEYAYAGITRIEVCVKNMGAENVKFSENRDFRHEDEKYCTDVILQKLKIGYIPEGEYRYRQNDDGLQNTYFYAYYLFEPTMEFWEEEFGKFIDEVPRYLQALYVSDIAWKLTSSILLPYHYSPEELEHAKERIRALLRKVDSETILTHPALDSFHRLFWLQVKGDSNLSLKTGFNTLAVLADEKPAYFRSRIEVILLRLIPDGNRITLIGFLKSPCFQLGNKPRLLVDKYADGALSREEISLQPSSWSYYRAKIKTNSFWDFEYTLQVHTAGKVELFVEFEGVILQTDFFLMPRAIFSIRNPERNRFVRGNYLYGLSDNVISIDYLSDQSARDVARQCEKQYFDIDKAVWAVRALAHRQIRGSQKIWLYHDCHGVEKNNAYYQFIHDFDKDDGVSRYYVVNDSLESKRHLFTDAQMRHVIKFRSKIHKVLFLAAEKIITAYVENTNWMAFGPKAMRQYYDFWNAEVVYLQHGVLHATQPWKYSFDRLLIDKEVVSTQFEVDNLTGNYGFCKDRLIMAGMPRYDYLDAQSVPQKKILLAPSWRKYLVRQKSDGQWLAVPKVFDNSVFYKEYKSLLESDKLRQLLEATGYTLEFKPHPILSELYANCFALNGPAIKMAPDSVKEEDYAILITDFSSYRFDFVYLKRAIAYFLPDEEMYLSGMCDYRQTDLPLGGQFGDLARTADELIDLLQEIILNDCTPKPMFANQMEGFFLHYDNDQCERIYQALCGD